MRILCKLVLTVASAWAMLMSGAEASVDTATGVVTNVVRTGISLDGLEFTLTYNSFGVIDAVKGYNALRATPRAWPFGNNWASSFHENALAYNQIGTIYYIYAGGDGGYGYFTYDPTQWVTFISSTSADKISYVGSAAWPGLIDYWESDTGIQRLFNYSTTDSRLMYKIMPSGRRYTYIYSGNLLSAVMTSTNRMISFSYNSNGQVTSLVTPEGRSVSFAYDNNNNLTSIQWQDGSVQSFQYQDANLPGALTGVYDESGNLFQTWAYNDTTGKAISSSLSSGVGALNFTWPNSPDLDWACTMNWSTSYRYCGWGASSNTTTIQDANGNVSTLNFTNISGQSYPTTTNIPAGSGCLASASNRVWDSNGNLVEVDLNDGTKTCRQYDTSHRVTLMVEGLQAGDSCATVLAASTPAPSYSRSTIFTYVGTSQTPSSTSNGLSVAFKIMHGQPDPFNANQIASCTAASSMPNGMAPTAVCKEVLQNSSGVGPNIVTSYSYDSSGQILTKVDPNSNLTTFNYYPGTSIPGAQGQIDSTVILQLHADDPAGSTSFVDTTLYSNQSTALGSATTTNSVSRFGAGSFAFDGSATGMVYVSDTPSLNLQGGSWTIELFVNINALSPTGSVFVSKGGSCANPGTSYSLGIDATGTLWGTAAGVTISGSTPLALNSWHHVSLVYGWGTLMLFADGNILNQQGAALVPADTSSPVYIGGLPNTACSGMSLNGFIDEVQFKSTPSYNSSYSVPTAAFANAGLTRSPAASGYTRGDLQNIVDATGSTQSFNLYDQAGRVLQTTSAKGIVTQYSYNPRGAIASVVSTSPTGVSKSLSYTYNVNGQLISFTNSDATTVKYSYDGAHRLANLVDQVGNSITYTYDAVSNITRVDVKDPNGVLSKTTQLSYDALNRVQHLVGAP